MAMFKKTGVGNFSEILKLLHNRIMNSGASVSLEERSDYITDNVKTAIRVYERYSFLGGNRLSLSVFLIEADNKLHLNLVTAGGSQAMFFKINRFGERNFLNQIKMYANSLIK